jgi:hypothetical protein
MGVGLERRHIKNTLDVGAARDFLLVDAYAQVTFRKPTSGQLQPTSGQHHLASSTTFPTSSVSLAFPILEHVTASSMA